MKICDFGWSISTNTMRGTFCGTPLYVSPELLKRKTYNNKIDVWSVGILTYELLFGRVPFEITTEQDFMKIVSTLLCRWRTKSSFQKPLKCRTMPRISFSSVWKRILEIDTRLPNCSTIHFSLSRKMCRLLSCIDHVHTVYILIVQTMHNI